MSGDTIRVEDPAVMREIDAACLDAVDLYTRTLSPYLMVPGNSILAASLCIDPGYETLATTCLLDPRGRKGLIALAMERLTAMTRMAEPPPRRPVIDRPGLTDLHKRSRYYLTTHLHPRTGHDIDPSAGGVVPAASMWVGGGCPPIKASEIYTTWEER